MLNKPKTDYKRQTTVLSVSLVLVGMMVLVPAINEKALATIDARASGDCDSEGATHKCLLTCYETPTPPLGTPSCIHFDNCSINIGEYLPCGNIDGPEGYPTSGYNVHWATKIYNIQHEDERGVVEYNVDNGKGGRLSLFFDNPFIGTNRCDIHHVGPGDMTYHACDTHGGTASHPIFFYGMHIVEPPAQAPDNTGGAGGGSGSANGGDANGGHGGNANGGDANGGDEGDNSRTTP
jgi:hypothetical protein